MTDERSKQGRRETDGLITELLRSLNTVSDQMESYKAELETAQIRLNVAADQSRWAKSAVKWAIVVGGIGVIVGIVGVIFGISARIYASDIVEAREDARVASCIQFNAGQEVQIRSEHRQAVIWANNIARRPRDAETQRRVDIAIAQIDKASLEAHPFQDCSLEAIAERLNNPPKDPAVTSTTVSPGSVTNTTESTGTGTFTD